MIEVPQTHIGWPPSQTSNGKFTKFAPPILTVWFAICSWQFSYDHRTSQDDVVYGSPVGFTQAAFVIACLFAIATVFVWKSEPEEAPRRSRTLRRIYISSILGTVLAGLFGLAVGWLFSGLLLR